MHDVSARTLMKVLLPLEKAVSANRDFALLLRNRDSIRTLSEGCLASSDLDERQTTELVHCERRKRKNDKERKTVTKESQKKLSTPGLRFSSTIEAHLLISSPNIISEYHLLRSKFVGARTIPSPRR